MDKLKRSTKVRIKSFEAIVISDTGPLIPGKPDRAYRVSIKDPYNGKHAFWTLVPEELIEILD